MLGYHSVTVTDYLVVCVMPFQDSSYVACIASLHPLYYELCYSEGSYY